jgi:Spy/CpxP family protein refolding chaperone
MSLRSVSALVLALLSLGGTVALAKSDNFPPQTVAQTSQSQSPLRGNGGRLAQELNLTPEQMQKMQAIRQRYKEQISQRASELRQAQQELRELMATTASADEVRAKYRQVEQLRQQLTESRFESTLAVRDLLTPEQRVKFVENMQKRRERSQKPIRDRQQQQS